MSIRRMVASIIAGGVTSVLAFASPAAAAENIRESGSWPVDEVVATCSDGSQIALGFDFVRNIHRHYDRDGNLVRESRNVNYIGIFQNLSTGERYTFRGTRNITFDFVAGTFTGTGNLRTVTQPGRGVVLHWTGRDVFDLATDAVLFSSGPKYDELSEGAAADVCGLFGLTV